MPFAVAFEFSTTKTTAVFNYDWNEYLSHLTEPLIYIIALQHLPQAVEKISNNLRYIPGVGYERIDNLNSDYTDLSHLTLTVKLRPQVVR